MIFFQKKFVGNGKILLMTVTVIPDRELLGKEIARPTSSIA